MKLALNNLIPHREMQFQPVLEDDDDISMDIKTDPQTHDNQWQLTEDVDAGQLNAFLDDALSDMNAEK